MPEYSQVCNNDYLMTGLENLLHPNDAGVDVAHCQHLNFMNQLVTCILGFSALSLDLGRIELAGCIAAALLYGRKLSPENS